MVDTSPTVAKRIAIAESELEGVMVRRNGGGAHDTRVRARPHRSAPHTCHRHMAASDRRSRAAGTWQRAIAVHASPVHGSWRSLYTRRRCMAAGDRRSRHLHMAASDREAPTRGSPWDRETPTRGSP